MAQTNFVKFDGIAGESAVIGHEGEIEVMNWLWDIDAPAAAETGSGSSAAKATASEFRFMHNYDKASPLLARACARGKAIKLVVLSARRAGESRQDFLKVTMKDVLITSVHLSAHDVMVQTVTLKPRSIAFEYFPVDDSGSVAEPVGFSWNFSTGTIK
jgi:type VI secretion system secreted protein Hcp